MEGALPGRRLASAQRLRRPVVWGPSPLPLARGLCRRAVAVSVYFCLERPLDMLDPC